MFRSVSKGTHTGPDSVDVQKAALPASPHFLSSLFRHFFPCQAVTAALEALSSSCAEKFPELPHGPTAYRRVAPSKPPQSRDGLPGEQGFRSTPGEAAKEAQGSSPDGALHSALEACRARGVLQALENGWLCVLAC